MYFFVNSALDSSPEPPKGENNALREALRVHSHLVRTGGEDVPDNGCGVQEQYYGERLGHHRERSLHHEGVGYGGERTTLPYSFRHELVALFSSDSSATPGLPFHRKGAISSSGLAGSCPTK